MRDELKLYVGLHELYKFAKSAGLNVLINVGNDGSNKVIEFYAHNAKSLETGKEILASFSTSDGSNKGFFIVGEENGKVTFTMATEKPVDGIYGKRFTINGKILNTDSDWFRGINVIYLRLVVGDNGNNNSNN